MLTALEERSSDDPGEPTRNGHASAGHGTLADEDVYELFLRDVQLDCRVGIYPSEKETPQRLRMDLSLVVRRPMAGFVDEIGQVVSYEDILAGIHRIASARHVGLLETLGDRLLAFCLTDRRVLRAWLTIEKLDIFGGAAVPGIRLERRQCR